MEKDLSLGPVLTSKYGTTNSISWLNQMIMKYITSIYGPFGYSYRTGNKDIDVNGRLINTEYIDKMVNNYTVFKGIIEAEGINTEEGFYNYMVANLFDVYNYGGTHFDKITLPILVATTRRGNIGEQKALFFFKNELMKKGVQCTIIPPTLLEDGQGIDGKFEWNGKLLTIQVKPYDSIMVRDGMVNAFSQGSLSLKIIGADKNVDYLVLYNLEKKGFVIVRANNTTIQGNLFIFPEDKVIAMI
jgi:hypothetical protein